MKSLVCFVFLLAFAFLTLAEDNPRERQIDDIREAVFRWQFEHNASGQRQNAQVYFLQVGEKDKTDPPDEFMKRFTNHKPPVRKVSACTANPLSGVLDKKTGQKGLIFRVTSFSWKSDSEVEVKGGYYEGGRSSSGNTYTVKKQNNKWNVTNDKMDWIS